MTENSKNIQLQSACVHGELWKVEELVEEGMDLHIALNTASYCGYLGIVKYLIKRGADIHYGETSWGSAMEDRSPLHCAQQGNNLAVVNYLKKLLVVEKLKAL